MSHPWLVIGATDLTYRLMRALALICLLAACDTGHLGNPLTLPVRAVVNGVENAGYQAQRDRVSAYLTDHIDDLNDPATLARFWRVAPVPPSNRAKVLREIAELAASPDRVEQATVITMVHL